MPAAATLACAMLLLGAGAAACDRPSYLPPDRGWCALVQFADETALDPPPVPNTVRGLTERVTGDFVEHETGAGTWRLGMRYSYRDFEFGETISDNIDLHTLRFPVSFDGGNDERRYFVSFAPGLATSSNKLRDTSLGRDDFAVAALGVLRWQQDRRTLLLGLAWDPRFGDERLYPVGGVERRFAGGWRAGLVLPAPYLHSPQGRAWQLRVSAYPDGGRWWVLDDEAAREFDFELRQLKLKLSVRRRVSRVFSVQGDVGLAFGRSLALTTAEGRPVAPGADDAAFAGITLVYHPRGERR